jgi:hypothetical protein
MADQKKAALVEIWYPSAGGMMNKTIWTTEKILWLKKFNEICKGNRKEIAEIMDMTYNQINGALRRFCGGKND